MARALFTKSVQYVGTRCFFLFRAWHDLTHIELNAEFDQIGEIHVARYQSQFVPEGLLREIFLADTVGQTEFASATDGGFVTNQRAFVFDYLNVGSSQAIHTHRNRQVSAA